MVEGLSTLFSRAKTCGLVDDFEFGRGKEAVTHLKFANNTILFCFTRWEEVTILKRILRCFEFVSGLKINLAKSMLMGVGCQNGVIDFLSTRMNFKVRKLTFFVSWAALSEPC